jgi:hypothetical protein
MIAAWHVIFIAFLDISSTIVHFRFGKDWRGIVVSAFTLQPWPLYRRPSTKRLGLLVIRGLKNGTTGGLLPFVWNLLLRPLVPP